MLLSLASQAQNHIVDNIQYTIHAHLNTHEKIVNGIEAIEFTNATKDSITYIWLHLYANAWKNDRTSYTDYSIKNDDARFYFSDKEERAYMHISAIKSGTTDVIYFTDSLNKEWVKVNLPRALGKEESVRINVTFKLKIPYAFDKLGYKENKILLHYWYPAIAASNQSKWEVNDYLSHRYINAQPSDFEVFLKIDEVQEYEFSVNNSQDITIEIDENTRYAILSEDSLQLNVGDNYWIKGGLKNVDHSSDQVFESLLPKIFYNKKPINPSETLLSVYEKFNKGQPIISRQKRTDYHSFLFEEIKAAKWYDSIKQIIGAQSFNQAMTDLKSNQYNINADDLRAAFTKYTNNSLSREFQLLHTSKTLYHQQKKRVKPAFLFNLKETDKYNYLSFAPVAGFNNYNKWMIGGLVHNYQLPYNKFNFILAPLYATGDRSFKGLGRVEYNIFKPKFRGQISLNASQFAYNEVSISSIADPLFYTYRRIVPALKFTFYKDETLLQKWTLLVKNYNLAFSDYTFETNGSSDVTATPNRYARNILGLDTKFSNDRFLYPHNISLQLFSGKEFIRAGITANYFFNYDAFGKGIRARLFGGKFFYITEQNFINQYNTIPYHFYMAGTSITDFTYSHYFLGRSEQGGWMSRQIIEKDGFFKVFTPMRNQPIGTSDNWLSVLNLIADIPSQLDPFKNLPFNMPIKLYADIGTYSNAWTDVASTGKFVYDAGVQISLFSEALNVYFPLLYSKVYRDYYKSIFGKNYFSKTISFSVNFEKLKPAKLKNILPL